jgi:hypothetical protein
MNRLSMNTRICPTFIIGMSMRIENFKNRTMTNTNTLKPNRTYRYLIILALITLAAIVIRLAFLSRPMFYDEALSYLEYATTSLPRLVARYNTPNNHIFHSVLIWISARLFNDF